MKDWIIEDETKPSGKTVTMTEEQFNELLESIKLYEREQCAKVCDALAEQVKGWMDATAYENAALFIRARGEVK